MSFLQHNKEKITTQVFRDCSIYAFVVSQLCDLKKAMKNKVSKVVSTGFGCCSEIEQVRGCQIFNGKFWIIMAGA